MIIVYMGDERNGVTVATLLDHKGIENLFLLTGGLEKFHESYPWLVEGREVPPLK